MIASLGMYDPPHLHSVNDEFWSHIRRALTYGPDHLTRNRPLPEIWRDRDMLLSQTCGRPYRLGLWQHVTLVGTPDYGLEDCTAGYYYSVIITPRTGGAPEGSIAINGADSQSGWAALYDHLTAQSMHPTSVTVTGSHAASITAVAQRHAQMAAIDAQSFRILQDHHPDIQNVTVIARTPERPALPFITAQHRSRDRVRAALEHAVAHSDAAQILGIRAIIDITHERYLAIPDVPAPHEILRKA